MKIDNYIEFLFKAYTRVQRLELWHVSSLGSKAARSKHLLLNLSSELLLSVYYRCTRDLSRRIFHVCLGLMLKENSTFILYPYSLFHRHTLTYIRTYVYLPIGRLTLCCNVIPSVSRECLWTTNAITSNHIYTNFQTGVNRYAYRIRRANRLFVISFEIDRPCRIP